MILGIIKDFKDQHMYYVQACEELNVEYKIIDIISDNWKENILKSDCDGFLIKPPGRKFIWKQMFDEKLFFINKIMKKPIYPNYEEIFLYENKRVMSYWLNVHNISHPETHVFFNKTEAKNFLKKANYPILFKPNLASAGIGIKQINNYHQGIKIVNKIFTKFNFFNVGYIKWNKKNRIPYPLLDDRQMDNILFQKKVDVVWEWRGVKIGNSYFAHKKLEGKNGMHSGSGIADYSTPPLEVLDFIKDVCSKTNFRSMNVDFFEDSNGKFYVNELQTFFGSHIQEYQMLVKNVPGRYIYNEEWVFEEGQFNRNNSCNLRVLDFINELNGENLL